jgi:hypothetical protein
MFFQLPVQIHTNLQQVVFISNTLLLIAALVIAELVYSGTSKRKRQHLKLFYPIILVFVGILIFAAYKQGIS